MTHVTHWVLDPWPIWPMTHGRAFSMMLSNVLVIHCDNERSEIKHTKNQTWSAESLSRFGNWDAIWKVNSENTHDFMTERSQVLLDLNIMQQKQSPHAAHRKIDGSWVSTHWPMTHVTHRIIMATHVIHWPMTHRPIAYPDEKTRPYGLWMMMAKCLRILSGE